MTALVIAEHDHGSLKAATLNTATAAIACGGEVHVLVAGHNASGAALRRRADRRRDQGAALPMRRSFRSNWPRTSRRRCSTVTVGYGHLLFPATAHGKNIAPRVAAKLDVAQISEITKVVSPENLRAPDLRGQCHCHGPERRWVARSTRVRSTGFDAAAATGGSASIERIAAVADAGTSSLVGREVVKSDRPELTAAKVVVSGGRALGSSEKFKEVLTPLADKLGAAVGASRAAVDAGYRREQPAGRPDRQDRSRRSSMSQPASPARFSTWPA